MLSAKLSALSWKQKNHLLVFGLLLLLMVIYTYAISPALEARAKCDEIQALLESSQSAPREIEQLELQLAELNSVCKTSNDSLPVHEQLLALVTGYCNAHELVLRDFPPPLAYSREAWKVETHVVSVEGSFIGLVQLLEYLHSAAPGKIVSADFCMKKNPKSKTSALQLTVYIQQLFRVT